MERDIPDTPPNPPPDGEMCEVISLFGGNIGRNIPGLVRLALSAAKKEPNPPECRVIDVGEWPSRPISPNSDTESQKPCKVIDLRGGGLPPSDEDLLKIRRDYEMIEPLSVLRKCGHIGLILCAEELYLNDPVLAREKVGDVARLHELGYCELIKRAWRAFLDNQPTARNEEEPMATPETDAEKPPS